MRLSKGWLATIIVLAVIVIDQVIKIWVKTSFYLGEDYTITSWFHLRFIENPGMAFGMEFGSKLFLTLFRLVAVALLIWYMIRLVRGGVGNDRKDSQHGVVPLGYLVCIALITAGAAGNIVDCLFYGEIFNNPMPPQVAQFVPWGDGYAGLLHGKVVDMFYFPLFSFDWPQWIPFIGGHHFSFFDPVFNFADAAISVGVVALITCYYRTLSRQLESSKTTDTPSDKQKDTPSKPGKSQN